MERRQGELHDPSHTWTDTFVQDMPTHPHCCFYGCWWLSLLITQPWSYLHCQQHRPGWIPTYSLKRLHYSTFFSFLFFFFNSFSPFWFLFPHPQFYWDITEIKHCISSGYTMWWSHTHIYCEVITTIMWVNTSITSHRYHLCVCVYVPVWGGHLRSSLLATIIQYWEL